MRAILDRRKLLKHGIGLASLASSNSIFCKQSSASADEKQLFLIIDCHGGWDQTLVFDNKINSTTIHTDSDATFETNTNQPHFVHNAATRPEVKRFFDLYGDSCTIINGIKTENIQTPSEAIITNTFSEEDTHIDIWGTLANKLSPNKVLPHLSIDTAPSIRTESFYSFYSSLKDIEQASGFTSVTQNFKIATAEKIREMIQKSYATLSKSEKDIKSSFADGKLNASLSLPDLLARNLDQHTAGSLNKRASVALNMLSKGYSQCASILDADFFSWSTYTDNIADQSRRFNDLFAGLANIIDEASELGIDHRLTVIVKSDLGRDGSKSSTIKGHWPYTSCLIFDKSITGGKTVGKSDEFLRSATLDPISGEVNSAGFQTTFHSIYAALFKHHDVIIKSVFGRHIEPSSFIL